MDNPFTAALSEEASSSMPGEQPDRRGRFVVYRTDDGELTFTNGQVVTFEPDILQYIETPRPPAETDTESVETETVELDLSIQQKLGAFAAQTFAVAKVPVVIADSPTFSRKGTTYLFHPNVEIVDVREQLRVLDNPLERIRRSGAFNDMYKSEIREALFKKLLDAYIGDERINKKLLDLRQEYIIPRFDTKGSVVIGKPPGPEETRRYLLQLEIGIVAFFEEQDIELAESAILDMIEAYYNLLFKHVCLIRKHANHYRQNQLSYEELCHEAHIELLNLIIDYLSYRIYIAEEDESNEDAETHLIRARFVIDSEGNFADIAEHAIIRAMRRFTWFMQQEKPENPTFKRKKVSSKAKRNSFDKSFAEAMLKDETNELLQASILTEREKIVLSLHFGWFIESLRGAKFKPDQIGAFEYPESASDMPPRPLTERQISELLGIRLNSVKAILHVALKACRKHIESQGIETLEELLP